MSFTNLNFNLNQKTMKKFLFLMSFILMASLTYAQVSVTGTITSSDDGAPLPGVNILVQGTTIGSVTNLDGEYQISAPGGAVLVFSYVGYTSQELELSAGQTSLDLVLQLDMLALDEIIVIGYGTQKKSDITGAVSSLPNERLEQIPAVNVAQALQGAIPGLTIVTNTAGAEQDDMSIMVRGRNSIEASNEPLIILDGIPFSGSLSEIVPEDVQSIEILKDASASAIYGSRASNGVILITTKKGKIGKPTINYNGYFGVQKIANMPDYMSGSEFYDFKNIREPGSMTTSEEALYQSGAYTDWIDATTQNGNKQQHSLSISGGTENVNYYISGSYINVKGVAVNDEFKRYSTRINLEAKITKWLKIGTNTQLSLVDRAGFAASWDGGVDGAYYLNPLTQGFNDDGTPTIYPWPEDNYWGNPLQRTLAESRDNTYKVISNNYLVIDVPRVTGLQYRLNTGIEYSNRERNDYYGRDTKNGFESQGEADTRNRVNNNVIIENILSYTKSFGNHNLFLTGLYGFQRDGWEEHRTESSGFPNDVLTWYQANVGNLVEPSADYELENLISQMLRINYGYDSRYMVTFTARRDGYSGFGDNRKWGLFPSVALGWNIGNEAFFSGVTAINQFKLRASYGQNGNQAVGPYETLARLSERSYLNGPMTDPGYRPTALGNPDLGWETSTTINVGIDYGFLANKVSGSIDYYNTDTEDLLLDRQISSVHGITSITQNIGATNNQGFELGVYAYPVSMTNFSWNISGTFSWNKNKIVSLYGNLDEDGNEMDDILNDWFIGEPIRVNYNRVIDGTWQTGDDIANSAQPTAMPGYAKVRDANGDGKIDADDRIILGQRDPKTLYSLTNVLTYKDFTLTFFLYGVTGVTRRNNLKVDDVWGEVRRNTTKKDWWTPDNPTNEYYANHIDAKTEGGNYYENASFMRLKDISLAYDLPVSFQNKIGFDKFRIYVAGRNLATVTEYGGMDPELSSQRDIPLEKEYVVGLILAF